ncbi:MAG: strawberry notch family protein [Bacteroidales bacterium]|nr:strawberry notch family protein [Bacteroidales bacterium]
MKENFENYVHEIKSGLLDGSDFNKRKIEKIAGEHDISNPTLIKELTELAIVRAARNLANRPKSFSYRFCQILNLYKRQMILSHRTSQSIMLQQYSTPAPIAFLAGSFVAQQDKLSDYYFEPSAGNGLLTIALPQERTIVNEIDDLRHENLLSQDYFSVSKIDATEPFAVGSDFYAGVITNPPFGKAEKPIYWGKYKIDTLDHVMALRALDTMKDSGRAAIIIGGHTQYDEKGRIQAGKNRIFFSYLYQHYHVCDVINIDKKLYSRQGTTTDVRLILIDGRKETPEGYAPLGENNVVKDYDELFDRVNFFIEKTKASTPKNPNIAMNKRIEAVRKLAEQKLLLLNEELAGPYRPASDPPVTSLDTEVPDTMDWEMHSAIFEVKEQVGGSINDYVRRKLGYANDNEMAKCLSAEQVDAVAMAIYNIEEKRQGIIIGDQTGIGKGRVAAAIIRYGAKSGLKPIFVTEKANLFSDMYRDLDAIGSANLVPFIVNSNEPKSKVKDMDGNVVYEPLEKSLQDKIFKSLYLSNEYDYVMMTYSQIASNKISTKQQFIGSIARNNILILDESHNAGGNMETSATARFFYDVVSNSKGVIFLSATFAKRPDNMPIYAAKTCMKDAQITDTDMVDAIQKGGVALQEVLSAALVLEGQMMRRERSFEGVEVNYITLDKQGQMDYSVPDKEQEHRAICDNITSVIRRIISFQKNHINNIIDERDTILKSQQKEAVERQGTGNMGVDNSDYFSKVHQVIGQMLFSIKAESVAERAIQRLKDGKAPIIAFSSTMGSFLSDILELNGKTEGETLIKTDFASVLRRGLEGVLRYTIKNTDGTQQSKTLGMEEFTQEGRVEYRAISDLIDSMSSGISISPIDLIKHRIEQAGYSVSEVTGRSIEIQFTDDNCSQGYIVPRKKELVNDAYRKFNNNEVDVLLVNQSGATGASAHAVTTKNVFLSEVRQRVMVLLQAEGAIDKEMQKRGRINRTGQVFKPIYDYITSAIPAEKRLMMVLKKKLKSLDANTTSNQKNSEALLQSDDFINKYGDLLVVEYLRENPEINEKIGDPLEIDENGKPKPEKVENAASRVSGRIAVLPVDEQDHFYNDMIERYQSYIAYLVQAGEYDLEVETMDLQAKTLEKTMKIAGKGGSKSFGGHTYIEKCEVNILKKPYKYAEISEMIKQNKAETTERFPDGISAKLQKTLVEQLMLSKQKTEDKYEKLIKNIPNESQCPPPHSIPYEMYINQRTKHLESGKREELQKLQKDSGGKYQILKEYLDYFEVGKSIFYPYGESRVPAICLGIKINLNAKNPYAPSAMLVRIAVSNSLRYMELNMASEQSKILQQIMGISKSASYTIHQNWDTICKESSADRGIRYIYTGNLLQAFGAACKEDKAKLISYTTADGEVKKGLLLRETFKPKEGASNTAVPVNVAAKCIRALGHNDTILANNGLSFMRTNKGISIFTDGLSRQKYDKILTNSDLRKYLKDDTGFQKISTRWCGNIDDVDLEAICDIIYKITGCCVSLTSYQVEMISHLLKKETVKPIPIFPKLMELEVKFFMWMKQDNPTGFEGLGMATVPDSFTVFKQYFPFEIAADERKQILFEMVREIAEKSNNFTNTTAFDNEPLDVRHILQKENINPADWAKQNKTLYRSETDVVRWVASEVNNLFNSEITTTTTLQPTPSQADLDKEKRLKLMRVKALAKIKLLELELELKNL